MKFEDFEASFIRENRKLKVYFLVIVAVLVCCLFLVLGQRKYFVHSGGEIFKERLLTVDVCKEGFLEITTGNPTTFFVTDGIISILKKAPFVLPIKDIYLLREVDKNRCRLVAKSKEKLLSFLITLQEDSSFPFNYKIYQIDQEEVRK